MDLTDRELLARTLQAEAGNQGLPGLLAAGSVILNRANSPDYGDGLRGAILAPGQFSAWNSVTGYAGGEQGQNMSAMQPGQDAYATADRLLSGNYQDPTGGATHYYNPSISNPAWGRDRAGGDWLQIGDHIFGSADASTRGAPQMAMQPTQPQGLLGQLGIQRQDPTAQGETALPFYQRSRFGNTMGNLAMAFNSLRQRPDDNIPRIITGQRATREQDAAKNRTIEWFLSQPDGARYAEMAEAMGTQVAFQVYQADAERARAAAANAAELARGEIREVDGRLVRVMPDGTVQEIYGGDQGPDVSDVTNLRKEFTGRAEVEDFQPIARQYANIVSAAATGTGPADITLVFSYMKLIDPSSSVQQGEQATAQSAGGTSAQLRGLYNSLLGQGSLDAATRDQFVEAATDLYNNAKAPYDQAVEYYTRLSTQLGYDPAQVIGFDIGYGGAPYVPSGPTNAPPLTPSAIAAGVTQQQWDNMTPQGRSTFP